MQPENQIEAIRLELKRNGIKGNYAEDLIEEWKDHLASQIEELLHSGYDEDNAQRIAREKLGSPNSLAKAAKIQKEKSSWYDKYPLLASSISGLLIILLSLGSLAAAGFYLTNKQFAASTTTLATSLFNLLPWIIGLLWLTHQARQQLLNRKSFACSTTLACLFLCSSFLKIDHSISTNTYAQLSFGIGYFSFFSGSKVFVTLLLSLYFYIPNRIEQTTSH
ncbi:permease prefix domain 1-containing protein [Puniceicoccaceae bacterium K14]|nr:permease prefix domain 1-containing protein [Puniceicoccaceae bacterium K14]